MSLAQVPAARAKPISASTRAGLVFPASRIKRKMRDVINNGQRVAQAAPVYLAGVLEYLAAEMVELAGNVARDNHQRRITPRSIQLALSQDRELQELLSTCIVAGGGVVPNINAVLLPPAKQSKPKRPKQAQAQEPEDAADAAEAEADPSPEGNSDNEQLADADPEDTEANEAAEVAEAAVDPVDPVDLEQE